MSEVAAEKPQTREQLKAVVADLTDTLTTTRNALHNTARQLDQSVEREKTASSAINDLKERLALAESENQRMRGYISRVQEDDVVREELVKVGDPDGAYQIVPKRKPTTFHAPNVYAERGISSMSGTNYFENAGCDRAQPKHWVTY